MIKTRKNPNVAERVLKLRQSYTLDQLATLTGFHKQTLLGWSAGRVPLDWAKADESLRILEQGPENK